MNLVASLQDRLKNQSREKGIAYASLLEQFALSRFLARLERSDFAERFILKGAQLFASSMQRCTARHEMPTS